MFTAPAPLAERLTTGAASGGTRGRSILLAVVAATAPRPSRRSNAATATTAFPAAADPATALGWQDVADTVELMNQLDTDKSETISWQEWSHGCAVWLHDMGQA